MNIESTDLICSYCGEIVSIYRKNSKMKTAGHIKDMYCPYCKEDRKFIEIKDRDKCYLNLLNKKTLTEEEKLIFDLLEARKEKINAKR